MLVFAFDCEREEKNEGDFGLQLTANKLQATDSRSGWEFVMFSAMNVFASATAILQPWLDALNLSRVSKHVQTYVAVEGECAGPRICPLSQVAAGMVVCIKKLETSPETTDRLRELGFCEQQRIKLLRRHNGLICQVCNARLALSDQLAEAIFVEPIHA